VYRVSVGILDHQACLKAPDRRIMLRSISTCAPGVAQVQSRLSKTTMGCVCNHRTCRHSRARPRG